MPSGALPGQRKGGQGECKVCGHPGRKEIEAMILNGAKYPAIIARMKDVHPTAPELIASNLSNHKTRHLLTNPITVESADGTKQTFLTGHYPSSNIQITEDDVPDIPSLEGVLKAVIGLGLHNMLNNPVLITPKDVLAAVDLLRKLGGGADPMGEFLGAWKGVADKRDELKQTAKRRRTRQVTLTETTEETTPIVTDLRAATDAVDAEWSPDELDNLALPAPGGGDE